MRWDEVYFTNCPMVSANNVDQELGWTREEFKKIGVEYAYFRSRPENNWYPHRIHNLDNLIRFGGLYPPIDVHADIGRTPFLGATEVYEGGAMLVRARDDLFRMIDLEGKKIGLRIEMERTSSHDLDDTPAGRPRRRLVAQALVSAV